MSLDGISHFLPFCFSGYAGRHGMAANLRRQTRRSGYHPVRLSHAHADRPNAQEDARQLASGLMEDEDFVYAPEPLQNDEIRELAVNMHNKKAVKEEVKRKAAKRKEKKPSVFKTMGYSISMVSTQY